MGRLKDKNILLVIPSDFYDEEQFEPLMEIFNAEDANVVVASAKLKEAVGMRKGRLMPDVMIVDSVEGIVGDSYVTSAGSGSRQVKGVYHGVILVGGKGARKYLWNDRVLHVLLSDRHRSGFILGAVGTAVPTLGVARLLEGKNATAEINKHTQKSLDEANALLEEEDVVVDDSVMTDNGVAALITSNGAGAITKFAQTVIDYVEKTGKK
tara:strand:- start:2018 stop:2647 length:630 start_codon:yes stop_codon:yes gene_type:complete